MRPLFRGDGCAINEAGISTAGNPLSRMLDAATADGFHAHQMREGYLAGMRPPMGLGGGPMLDPMMAKQGSPMDHAWQEIGPMRPHGPVLGESMPDQLMRRMGQSMGPDPALEAGFFSDMAGPMGMPSGADWGQEFSARPPGPGPIGMAMPPVAMRPPGADWGAEFARPPMQPAMGHMEAAFQQAQAAAAHAEMAAAQQPHLQQPVINQTPISQPMINQPMPMDLGFAGMNAAFYRGLPQGMPQGMPPPVDMDAAFQQAQMQSAFQEAQSSQEQQQSQQEPASDQDLAQAAQMVEMLRSSGNPKFANSQFVSFIDQVSKGDLQFKDNTVVDRDGNQVDWDALYDTEAATASESEKKELENLWQASGRADGTSLDQAWRDAEPELEDAWQAAAAAAYEGDASYEQMMMQAWLGDEMGMEPMWKSAGNKSEYEFMKENAYLDSDDPLALAQRLLREGRDREALLALEAEVQKNPESSEGWRLLGQLYAELDQDVEAIQCLRRGHEVDPYNLDSLLALGVSCTNELDQLPALRYLRMWIENHEEHAVLVQGLTSPPEYEYDAWRQQVTTLFNNAAQANPLDADVFVALGVMENINRNYDAAAQALATACRLRPHDHTVWNKLGATLANSGKSDFAVIAYHQGLQLKPNYARSWSNLAIAHANLGQHADAARFYLSSLVLNPDATHIWNFLHNAVLNMNKTNAFEAIDQRDLAACTKLIDGVLDPESLPRPSQELPQPPDEILASIGL